MKQTENMKI